MTAIFSREFKSYFTSPLGYVFIGVYLFFSGLFFYLWTLMGTSSSEFGVVDFTSMFAAMFFVLMITVPLLTMRLFSEEMRNKTDQLTLTAPISLFGLVTAKFAAAYAIFLLSTAIMPIYGLVLSEYAKVSWETLLGNMAGLLILGAVYTAVGIFVSSLTENQMIAAIVSVFVNIGFLLSSVVAPFVKIDFISETLYKLSLLERYNKFTVGIFEIENVLFFLSIVVVLLFLTVRFLERRRWS